ncbi:MAG: hypothetical protein R2827_04495 [Bdellovibrionales bacterium]
MKDNVKLILLTVIGVSLAIANNQLMTNQEMASEIKNKTSNYPDHQSDDRKSNSANASKMKS